jgi:hypothetical protein
MANNANGVVLLIFACGLAGCGSGSSSSSSPALTPLSSSAVVPVGSPTVSSISGFVSDSGFRPLARARVEVLDGPQAGTSAIADASGQVSLSGTFDSATRFRASSDGHVSATQTWNCSIGAIGCPTNGRPWLGFYLAVLASPVNIAGNYTLTITADTACVGLPGDARTRTYAATITPGARFSPNSPPGTAFHLTVTGALFLGTLNGFDIGVAGDYVDFFLDGGHDPPVVEQLAVNTYLALSGNAAASIGTPPGSTISAPLEGWIDYCVMPSAMSSGYNCGTSNTTGDPIPGAAVTRAHCESNHHRLILTRQ